VHHSPARLPLSERLAGSLRRFIRVTRPSTRHRSGRLALGALVSTVLTALVLSAPVVSGAGGGEPLVAFESFASTTTSRTTDSDSPVVMGRDGRPVSSSTFAGANTPPAQAGESTTDVFAGPAPTAPATTGSAPAEAAAPAPTEAAAAPSSETPVESASPVIVAEPAPEAPAPAPAPAAPADPGTEGQVLALVNAERAAVGCGALAADSGLAAVARAHSADMRDRGYFDHVNPEGLSPFDRAQRAGISARAENIAYGQQDPAAVMDSWMNSAGHRANILNCGLTRLGVGVAEGAGGPWWTQLFA
jgi:uncharacterized protein YkwD